MTAIDREPCASKMIRLSNEVHDMLNQAKIIPEEPYNNCLKRIIAENNYLKRHYITEAPRESMARDLQKFVLNAKISDDLVVNVCETHIGMWNKLHPYDKIKTGEMIHHINGDHNDNHPDNLIKITREEHGRYHKELNSIHNVKKYESGDKDITTDVPNKVL